MCVADGECGVYVGSHAGGELGGAGGVERDGQNAAQQAAVEGGDPLGAVFGPDEDAVAGADAALDEQSGKTAGELGAIRP